MPHPLEVKIGAVRRRAARLVWSIALSRLFGVLVAVILTWSVLDYLIRFQDRGLRFIGSLAALGVAGWAVRRFLQTVRGAHFQLVDIALRVERSFPAFQDRLASTIQFLHESEDDLQAGSASLRRAVIAETSAQIEGLNLEQVLEPRPAHRAMATAVAIACLALASIAMHPLAARTAIMRLLNPWGDVSWPQTHHLAVKDPVRRLAAGRALEVTVIDAEDVPLPEDVWLHVRYSSEGDSPHEVVEPMQFVNGEMVARKEGVSKALSYRAVGGDDRSMPWIDLEVVEPPAIEQLSITLRYPEYTGWAPASSQRHLRALSGTRVEMRGRATKPLSSASVELDDETSIPARIEADGSSFSIPASADSEFVLTRSGAYWLKLTDRDGFSGGEDVRYEIRVIEDVTPSVTLVEPDANAFVTPEAVVPLKILAKDDLAIAEVAFQFSRSDKSEVGDESVKLYVAPPRTATSAAQRTPENAELDSEHRPNEPR